MVVCVVYATNDTGDAHSYYSDDEMHEIKPLFFEVWYDGICDFFDSIFVMYGLQEIPFYLKYLTWANIVALPFIFVVVVVYRLFFKGKDDKDKKEKETTKID
ncbi:unnamed protein product [Moneuplotes crassus]|uniref:Uncharacterized protein n=1 Tax=Euplotes crassus TaxID=5936 RepID=A0AAD1Y2P3_EUPCR|nr:unnamed protein product [Moneuplotes crassus]